MKKNLLCAAALVVGISSVDAQVLFSEDFQSNQMPASFTITDVDGLPVHANVSQFTDAWIVADDFADPNDKCAMSTSWYDPAGQSDDWMMTGGIALGASGNLLSWEARAQDPNYPDGYEVWVNTVGATPNDMMSGTMVFSVANEADVNTIQSTSLDAFANQTVYIGWRNNSTDQFILLIDDISVATLSPVDAEMTGITTNPFQAAPASVPISFDVTNTGQNTITSFDANWTDGTSNFNQTFTANIASLGTSNFTFNDQLAVTAGNSYNVTVTLSNVNGAGPDGNANNDAGSLLISGMGFIPNKVVVGEEATGTWCGWCPRGWDFMEYMAGTYPQNWVGIAVHNSDPMVVSNYDSGMGGTIGGYPSGHVDRDPVAGLDIDPSQFEGAHTVRAAMTPPCAINVSTVVNGNNVDITVEADFAAGVQGDYRLNCVVTEDGIQDNSYDQVNYYDGSSDPLAGWGIDWSSSGDPTPGSMLTYNHVARAILGGWDGQTGTIPSSVNAGEQHSYTFSYTVPGSSDINNMHAVGMIIDQTTGEILNAGTADLFVGVEENEANFGLSVFPNPTNGLTNINVELNEASEVTVEVFNMVGQNVSIKNYGTLNGSNILPFDGTNLDAGVYFINVIVNGEKLTKKVTITK